MISVLANIKTAPSILAVAPDSKAMAITIFLMFVGLVLGLSFYFARKAKSASGYFAAGGSIHWAVNGISFAGDYLSAASFLGICGMIATMGYDGFLYSIGYLAGWIVALFVVAEPMKRLGKYTFTDALDSKYNSRGIQMAAAISTLIVSIFYLIPQMVGAGVLVTPLLGMPHYAGVIMVGIIVITIVATAGMTSTTYVQFLKGALLIICSLILVVSMCVRGFSTEPDQGGAVPFYKYKTLEASIDGEGLKLNDESYKYIATNAVEAKGQVHEFVKLEKDGKACWWSIRHTEKGLLLDETQWKTAKKDGTKLINGLTKEEFNATNDVFALRQVGNLETINGEDGFHETGSFNPIKMLALFSDEKTLVKRWFKAGKAIDDNGDKVTVFYPVYTTGNKIMRPGLKFKVEGSGMEKLNFISLMLALFCGTAALPHILIRYYTVPTPACARKSTIIAIGSIGLFYVLTLFMGLGAMASGVINLESGNMSAPLLAKSFGMFLFAIISAIAFATVLGTVSGLIVAASGAIAHDIMDRFMRVDMTDKQKVNAGKISAFGVGGIAIVLGILFKGMNVSFLVGWAFAVAASANLPAIIMLLFWKKTTSRGIVASIIIGTVSALTIILLSPAMWAKYGMTSIAPVPLNNPGIISIPLSFATLVVVSLMTQGCDDDTRPQEAD